MTKCIGCGVILQDSNPFEDGYVSNFSHDLCERCFKIKNYGQNRDTLKTNVDFISILNEITDDDMIVYVSSLLTLNLDFINKFKNVILVLTKRDILPKSVKDKKIIDYINNNYGKKEIVIVSSYKKYNLDLLYKKLKSVGNGKKIYFVGTTNSGKSTLINEMIKSYNNVLGNITTSSFPSTTLSTIEINIGDLNIVDTPGIVIPNSIINTLNIKEIKKINLKKEIKPITYQVSGFGSILIDNMLRIDYKAINSSMTLYISNSLNVESISQKNNKLKDCKNVQYVVPSNYDLVIEDIGFIKITNSMKIKVYYLNDISIMVRKNMI